MRAIALIMVIKRTYFWKIFLGTFRFKGEEKEKESRAKMRNEFGGTLFGSSFRVTAAGEKQKEEDDQAKCQSSLN